MDDPTTWDDLRRTVVTYSPHKPYLRALSDAQAEDVRRRYHAGSATQSQLAREYGVDRNTIWNLLHEHTYRASDTPPTVTSRITHLPDFYLSLVATSSAAWAKADAAYEERCAKPNRGWSA